LFINISKYEKVYSSGACELPALEISPAHFSICGLVPEHTYPIQFFCEVVATAKLPGSGGVQPVDGINHYVAGAAVIRVFG